MDDPYGPGKRWFLLSEEQLREKILELSPDIHRDTGRMEDLIRELVKLEREKAGLDNPYGTLELWKNREKKSESHPDLVGAGRIAGRSYRVAAWFSGSDKLKVSLLPK